MNPDELIQMLQRGLRITLGATTSLVEAVQDPNKRDARWSDLQSNWEELAHEWAAKGEMTEQEARNFVDTLMAQQRSNSSSSPPSSVDSPAVSTPVTRPNTQLELEELTAQIAAMRAELENLRKMGDNN